MTDLDLIHAARKALADPNLTPGPYVAPQPEDSDYRSPETYGRIEICCSGLWSVVSLTKMEEVAVLEPQRDMAKRIAATLNALPAALRLIDNILEVATDHTASEKARLHQIKVWCNSPPWPPRWRT